MRFQPAAIGPRLAYDGYAKESGLLQPTGPSPEQRSRLQDWDCAIQQIQQELDNTVNRTGPGRPAKLHAGVMLSVLMGCALRDDCIWHERKAHDRASAG
jgi:hypothetical protein